MNPTYTLHTHGDPPGAVQRFIQSIWSAQRLDGLLAIVNDSERPLAKPRLLVDPAQAAEINPFQPIMTINAARLIPELLQTHPGARLGALLRPCEVRAWVEMQKRGRFPVENLLILCVDCLGTLPLEEYRWRLEHKTSPEEMTSQALQFARQGGINAYRFREACQACASPQASGADVDIFALGLPVHTQILVRAGNEATAGRLELESLTDGLAPEELVEQHARISAQITERHQRLRARLVLGLDETLPENVDDLIARLENCSSCQQCMEVCPICTVSRPQRSADGHYQRQEIVQWLASCAGCGMCEQACENHLPLSTIFSAIRHQVADELSK